jgi:hypothetical protein
LGGLFGMVYEHLSICFTPKDPFLGFSKLFQTIVIVARGDIPKSMTLVLGANKLLAIIKHIVKPYFLASKPSSTYTLIGSRHKLISKMFLIMFFKLLFKKSYKMSGDLWRTLSPLLGCSMVLILLFITNMGNMKEGVTIIESKFKHEAG